MHPSLFPVARGLSDASPVSDECPAGRPVFLTPRRRGHQPLGGSAVAPQRWRTSLRRSHEITPRELCEHLRDLRPDVFCMTPSPPALGLVGLTNRLRAKPQRF